jgi:hypothetical protein
LQAEKEASREKVAGIAVWPDIAIMCATWFLVKSFAGRKGGKP